MSSLVFTVLQLSIAKATASEIEQAINQYSSAQRLLEQVNSVSQLRDVSPEDWAYKALLSVTERYGCIAGFPKVTYQGKQVMSRYEFAAGLNSCLQQIERFALFLNFKTSIRLLNSLNLSVVRISFTTFLPTSHSGYHRPGCGGKS